MSCLTSCQKYYFLLNVPDKNNTFFSAEKVNLSLLYEQIIIAALWQEEIEVCTTAMKSGFPPMFSNH